VTDPGLYRTEAISQVAERSVGRVSVSQPVSLVTLTGLALSITIVISVFLSLGEYARKVTVKGFIRTDSGIAEVVVQNTGIVEKVLANDGESVEKGQPLLQISSPYTLTTGKDSAAEILAELSHRKRQVINSIDRVQIRFELDDKWQSGNLKNLKKEQQQIEELHSLQKTRTEITANLLEAHRNLRSGVFVSETEIQRAEGESLNEKKALAQINLMVTNTRAEIWNAEHQKSLLPLALQDRLTEYDAIISELNQQITNIEGRTAHLVKAPIGGRITASYIKAGASVTPQERVFSIVPYDSGLYAWLLIPSRAAGFAKEGQTVRLMYDSFPYQQFGTQAGTIISISDVAVGQDDVPGPLTVSEPVFLAKVRLGKETIAAFGQEKPLQVDMQLSADIILAKRSILEWLLEPILTLRGRTG